MLSANPVNPKNEDGGSSKYSQHIYLVGTEIAEKTDKHKNRKLSIYYSEDKGLTFKDPVKEIEDVSSFNGRKRKK